MSFHEKKAPRSPVPTRSLEILNIEKKRVFWPENQDNLRNNGLFHDQIGMTVVEMNVYGYIWIPPREKADAPSMESAQRNAQSQKLRKLEQEQREAMRHSGVSEAQLYVDTTEARPAYHALLKAVRKGDRIVLAELESLGDTMQQILEQWQFLTEKKSAFLTILDMPALCTATGRGALDSLVAEIMTETLTYLIQKQKKLRHEQQVKGIQAAKSRGVRCGRAPREIPEGFDAVFAKWEIGAISVNQAAKTLGVANKTFKKWAEAGAQTET